jgi:hypothetical protein
MGRVGGGGWRIGWGQELGRWEDGRMGGGSAAGVKGDEKRAEEVELRWKGK